MTPSLAVELLRRTVIPAVGVGPVKVTVPTTLVVDPPMTVLGRKETLCSAVGTTWKVVL